MKKIIRQQDEWQGNADKSSAPDTDGTTIVQRGTRPFGPNAGWGGGAGGETL